MSGKDLDGFIDKMGILIVNQSEMVVELGQNEFINELSYDLHEMVLNDFDFIHFVA